MPYDHTNERRSIGQIAGFLISATVFTGLLLGVFSVADAGGENAEIRASVDADASNHRVQVILDPKDGMRKVPITTVQFDRTALPTARCQGEGLVDPLNVGALEASGTTVAAYCDEFAFYAGDDDLAPAIPADRPTSHRHSAAEFSSDDEPVASYGMLIMSRYEVIANQRNLDAETMRFLEMNLWGDEREFGFITS
jgi:hypothetical protein